MSKRLKEIVAIKVLEESVIYSKSGRRIIGYSTTDRGRKIIELAKEFEKAIKSK